MNQSLPEGNVRISLDRLHLDRRDREGFSAMVRYRDPKISASVGSRPQANGLNVFAMRGNWSAALGSSGRSSMRRERQQQFLVLAIGSAAQMAVVKAQPRVLAWPFRGPGVVYQVTGTSMRVRVVSANAESVRVRLEPYVHTAGVRGHAVRIESLVTTVILRPGVPHAIMAHRDQAQSVAAGWLSSRQSNRDVQTVMVIRVDVGQTPTPRR